jgi:hypothetical protein
MQKIDLKQGFPHGFSARNRTSDYCSMQNSKSLSELLARGGKRLSRLVDRSAERAEIVAQVRAALPARLAESVASAGLDGGRLTIGVVGGAWASRLRYSTELLRKRVTKSSGQEILTVKIRVVPPVPKI